jgi:hypothetical protein
VNSKWTVPNPLEAYPAPTLNRTCRPYITHTTDRPSHISIVVKTDVAAITRKSRYPFIEIKCEYLFLKRICVSLDIDNCKKKDNTF